MKSVHQRLEALLGDAVERSLEAHENIERTVRARRGKKGKAGQNSAPIELPPELTAELHEMVLAKTQIRATVEAENAQRERKIAQLNDFIARFSAGTRSSQVQSRRKEVERLQTTELARSNIQRPYIKFAMQRPSGKLAFECSGVSKSYGDLAVISGFDANVDGDAVEPLPIAARGRIT